MIPWEISLSFFWLLSFSLKVILISQMFFGIFPVGGLRHRRSSHLSFKLNSFFFIYSTLVQCGIILLFSTSIYKQLNSRIEYSKIGKQNIFPRDSLKYQQFSSSVKFIFFLLNFLVYLNFTLVARKWPQFVFHCESSERKLLELQVMQHQDVGVKRRVKTVLVVVMVMAFSKSNLDLRSPVMTRTFFCSWT